MPLVRFDALSEENGRSIQLPKCNREACTEQFAPCFNRGTKTYYCVECARDMNRFPAWDGKPLCDMPEHAEISRMFTRFENGLIYVGKEKLQDAKLHPDFYAPNYTEQIAALEDLT